MANASALIHVQLPRDWVHVAVQAAMGALSSSVCLISEVKGIIAFSSTFGVSKWWAVKRGWVEVAWVLQGSEMLGVNPKALFCSHLLPGPGTLYQQWVSDVKRLWFKVSLHLLFSGVKKFIGGLVANQLQAVVASCSFCCACLCSAAGVKAYRGRCCSHFVLFEK